MLRLARSGAWLIRRPIAGTDLVDAASCYPLLCCERWTSLGSDLEDLEGIVSVTAVTDPLGSYTFESLQSDFGDLVRPFKTHYVVHLTALRLSSLRPQHRRQVAKSSRTITVERCEDPMSLEREWVDLYSQLVRRHEISGLAAFSPATLGQQLRVPGLVAYRALIGEITVGIVLWYVSPPVCYYHLGAYSPAGYKSAASYAIFWRALEDLATEGLLYANLGGGAGLVSAGTDGLSRFKSGWATEERSAYLCGKILEPAAYAQCTSGATQAVPGFFPAYRS